jgi:amino acid adenylation domain-containing protein
LHNITFFAHALGQVPAEALSEALGVVMARHPMLRTKFRMRQGRPEQCTVMPHPVPIMQFDASAMDEETLRERLLEICHTPFDLEQAPLVRPVMYQLPEGNTGIAIVFHHLVMDGWSYWKLIDELGAVLGEGKRAADEPVVEERAYFDYVDWQRDWLASPAGEAQWDYWKHYLGTDLPTLQLPTDRPRVRGQERRAKTHTRVVTPELYQRLNALAQKHASTLYAVMLSAYQILLHRHSGQDTVVVGCPVPGRTKGAWFPVVGEFVNPLPLMARFTQEMRLPELLRETRNALFRGLDNQDFPFSEMVERMRLLRAAGEDSIFQTTFVFQKLRSDGSTSLLLDPKPGQPPVRWGKLDILPGAVRKSNAARGLVDFSVEITEMDRQLHCDFWYDEKLFDHATIARMADQFFTLLQAMTEDDAQPVGRIALLPEAERELLARFNATARDFPRALLIHQMFEACAANTPEAPALQGDGCTLSYAELNRRANRLAHRLIALGIRPESRVAICAERGIDMVTALLATLKAGGAYVPLDPAYPAERLAVMLEDSAPMVLLVQSELLPALCVPEAVKQVLVLDDEAECALPAGQAAHDPDAAALGHAPGQLAYVIYTSGSTGRPKGVMVEHGSVVNLVHWHCRTFDLAPGKRSSSTAGVAFDACAWEIWPTLCIGATLVLPPRAAARDPEQMLAWWEQETLHTSFLVTPLAEIALARRHAQPQLRQMLIGGDRLRHRPEPWPAFDLINNYGPTETTVVATSGRLSADDAVLHIGRPIDNTQVHVLDAHLQQVPIGVAGEIYIGGVGVARGYLNQPAMSAETFIPDPYAKEAGARLYKTGDLARYRPDGTIEYLGRNDHQVKIRGFRIELGEIEAKLVGLEGIREAVVVAREGQAGTNTLVAYLVAPGTRAPDTAAIRVALAKQLADYMLPSAYVVLQALPLTPNGKLDGKALPVPDQQAYARPDHEAPQGEMEQAIAAIWSEVLQQDRVGRHDIFFELGGHSLLAMQLVARLHDAFDVQLPLAKVFEGPTVAALAENVTQARLAQFDAADIERLLQDIGRMSDEEVEALLAQEQSVH